MSFKYPKNVIYGVSVVAALMAATVLLGGYANNKTAAAEDPVKQGCCPVTGKMIACPQMMPVEAKSTDCNKTPCTEGCPKPCCTGENDEGVCDNPCPIPCPKPCCAENTSKGCCGMADSTGCRAVEAVAQ